MGDFLVCFDFCDKKKFSEKVIRLTKEVTKMISRTVATRALLAVRAAAKPATLQPVKSFHHQTWVSGPPRRKVSSIEMVAHFSVIMVAFFAAPAYILANLRNYRGLAPDEISHK